MTAGALLDDDLWVECCLLALDAVAATRGVFLTAAEQVLIARIRIRAQSCDAAGRRGYRLVVMTSDNRLAVEKLVASRTGKAITQFRPAMEKVHG